MSFEAVTSSPLTWPAGWKRTRYPVRSRFGKWNHPVTIAAATNTVLRELELMGIPGCNVIISTNLKLRQDGLPYSQQREPEDKGVSVWWKDGPKEQVIALDKYDRIADNLHAIGKTIEAMRGIERWGSGEILERTFTGFQALPDPNRVNWRGLLNYHGTDLEDCKRAYRRAMLQARAQDGDNDNQEARINQAWAQAQEELSC